MPVYVFKCSNGHTFDEYRRLAEYDAPCTCKCGADAERQIVPTMLNMDMPNWERYISPTTGKLITSYKERRADMAESNCVDYEPSMKNYQAKMAQENENKLMKAVEETVEREIEAMPSHKKELLSNEIEDLDIDFVRQTVQETP